MPPQIRQQPEAPFRESARAVDLTAAEIIVSVGRGIRETGNIPMVRGTGRGAGRGAGRLAAHLRQRLAAHGAPGRQSGQTVAPKLYIAVGISGAIQHLVGMKGAKTIVAINKDADAPIFEVADYGIVGDLFEVVPALTELLRQARGLSTLGLQGEAGRTRAPGAAPPRGVQCETPCLASFPGSCPS